MLVSCAASPDKDTAQPSGSADTEQTAIALPPSFNERPAEENALQNLQPLKGVNVDTLFSEKLKDPAKRFDRVENAVVDLAKEFESLKPSIIRLVAVENDIQDLITQLDVLLQEDSAHPPQQIIPQVPPSSLPPTNITPTSSPEPASITPPVSSAGGAMIKDLRVGHYAHKARIVLDISKETPHTIDLDNNENLLVIELHTAVWTKPTQKSINSSLLSSYTVESMNNGQGSRIILHLKKPTEILEQMALKPGANPNFRIFVDLKT